MLGETSSPRCVTVADPAGPGDCLGRNQVWQWLSPSSACRSRAQIISPVVRMKSAVFLSVAADLHTFSWSAHLPLARFDV